MIKLQEDWTEEFAWAWCVRFDTREYLETGDQRHRPMSRALYVPKATGEVAWLPTAMSTEVSACFLDTGVRPYGPRAAKPAPGVASTADTARTAESRVERSGGLARLDATGVRRLTLARLHRPRSDASPARL